MPEGKGGFAPREGVKMIKCRDKIHRYRRYTNDKGKSQWKCMDCPSSTWRIGDLIGNTAHCYHCRDLFRIDAESLESAKVKCSPNSETCKANIRRQAESELGNLGSDVLAERRIKEVFDNDPEEFEVGLDKIVKEAAGAGSDPEQEAASIREAIRKMIQ